MVTPAGPTRGRPAKPEIDALHVGHDTSSSDQMGAPLHDEPNPRGASPWARVRDEWPNPLSDWRFRARLRLRNSNTLVRHLPMPGTSDGAAPSHACDRIDRNLPPDGVPFCDRYPLAVDKRCGRRVHPSDRFLDTTRIPGRCGGARCTRRALCMFERIQRHRSLGRVGRHRRRGPGLPPAAGPQACRGARSSRRPSILHYLPSTRSSRPIGIRSLNSCARYPPARLASVGRTTNRMPNRY